jgi:hypothetical protein
MECLTFLPWVLDVHLGMVGIAHHLDETGILEREGIALLADSGLPTIATREERYRYR